MIFPGIPLLALGAWGLMIWGTYGMYREVWVGFMPVIAILPFVRWPARPAWLEGLGAPLLGIFFAVLVAYAPPLMYAQADTLPLRAAAGLNGLCFLLALLIPRHGEKFLAAAVALAGFGLCAVVTLSPKPFIDVWYFAQQASDTLLAGGNPYTGVYKNIYEANGPPGTLYPPMMFYWQAPFRGAFGDVRYGLCAAAGIAAFLLGRLLGGRRGLLAAALFLSFPALPFVIEQSWNDPVSVMLLFAAALCFHRDGKSWAIVLLGAFCATKQYNFLVALPLLAAFSRGRGKFRDIGLFLLLPLLLQLPFLIADPGALIRNLTGAGRMNGSFFLSLADWAMRRGMEFSDVFALTSGLGLLLWTGARLAKRGVSPAGYLVIASSLLWILLWYSHTAANYLWFATAGLWLALGASSETAVMEADWGLFWISRFIIIFALPPVLSDISLYHQYAFALVDRGFGPYADLHIEYPPGALPFFVLPRFTDVFSPDHGVMAYRFCFHLMSLTIDAFFFRYLRKICGGLSRPSFFYIAATLILGPLLYDRLDLLIGICFFVILAERRHQWRAAAVIATGAVIKFVPLLVVPVLFAREKKSRKIALLTACVAPLLISALVVAAMDGDVSFLSRHSKRGIQIESIYGAGLLALEDAVGLGIGIENNYGAYHLSHAEAYKPFAVALFLLAMAGAAIWAFLRYLAGREDEAVLWGWILLLTFVIFNRVLSPQFFIWLSVAGSYVLGNLERKRQAWWVAVHLGACGLTTWILCCYQDLLQGDPLIMLALNLRNLLLASLIPLSIRWWAGRNRPLPAATS